MEILDRPRKRVVVWSALGALICFVSLVSGIESSSFELKLVTCFLFFLFFFHAAFGAYWGLTVTHSRAIDYVYLGITAVGVIILARNYEAKRQEYIQLEAQDAARVVLRDSKLEMKASILTLHRIACEPTFIETMPEYCNEANKLVVGFSEEDDSGNRDASQAVASYLNGWSTPKLADWDLQAFLRLARERARLSKLHERIRYEIKRIELLAPLPTEDIRRTMGLFTWPFILAFAFALRITKTTIEVLGWAK